MTTHDRVRRRRRAVALMAMALAALTSGGIVPEARAQEAHEDGYVCPPCGCSEDGKVTAEAGNCTACGMKRIKPSEIQRAAILLFDGVQIIDYTAPWEVFGQAGFEVFTVSKTGQPVTTAMGMSVNPKHSFANAPKPTILLVPGGGGVRGVLRDPESLEWVKATATKANHVLSVCNGAFILAEAGLLDGQKATTFYHLLDDLEARAPKVTVVRDARWVDNGKVITSAGLSSGIDSSLYLVSKIRGLASAQNVALNLEYDWKPDGGFARGALAEKYMPSLTGRDWEGVQLLSTAGGRDRWEARYKMTGQFTAVDLMARVKTTLDNMRQWRSAEPAGKGKAEGSWVFEDDAGKPWNGVITVEPDPAGSGGHLIGITVSRAGSPPPAG